MLGVEIHPPDYNTPKKNMDPSLICGLHHSSQQHQNLNPLSEARDQTHIMMDASRVLNLLSHNRNSNHKAQI